MVLAGATGTLAVSFELLGESARPFRLLARGEDADIMEGAIVGLLFGE